jgi:glycine oxidase
MADCVIVGAGLIGMLTARELAAAGMRVTLLERGEPARESSWAGGGILSPLYPWRYPDPVNLLARWSQQHYPEICGAVEQASGIDPQLTRSGLIIADIDNREQLLQWADRFRVNLQVLDSGEVRKLEPRLGLTPAAAAWLPDVAQVRNPRLAQSLRVMLEKRGVEIRTGCAARDWVIEAGRVKAVRTTQGEVGADCFVVASGAWSAELLASTGLALPIEPVLGQMILFKGPAGFISPITLYKGHYLIPRRDGHILAGSTLEHVGFEKRVTDQGLEELKQAAFELIPDLASVPIVQHWAGLRPGSPDGIPMVGPHPEIGNLFINAGHFRNGVVLGPASAKILTDQVLSRSTELDPLPYLPETITKTKE